MIRKIHNKYYLFSKKTGRKLGGPYDKKEDALKRERQVQYFKHLREEVDVDTVIEFLKNIIAGTEWENRLYLAGGIVRDKIMGRTPKDVDIVVDGGIDAGIEAAKFIAQKVGVYKEGSNPVVFEKFGTAKLRIPIKGEIVEIEFIAPRKEKYTPGSRKPEVEPATLRDDAFRRDFTINSLFQNLTSGEIYDLTGMGIEDLKNKIIRTTGDPDWIFKEDPLRILRAIRFALKYNFKLPLAVIRSIKNHASELKNISSERIKDELHKILLLEKPSRAIRLFKITGILDVILPELKELVGLTQNATYHKHDAFKHTLDVLDNTPPEIIRRLAALFHDIGKAATRSEKDGKIQFINHAEVGAEITRQIMKRLNYSNADIDKITKIVKNHMKLKQAGSEAENLKEKTLRKFVYHVADVLEPILDVIHADNISHSESASMPNQIEKIRERIKEINIEDLLNSKSLLTGEEIAELGAKGKLIGEIKSRILEKVIENPNFTKKDAIALAKNMIMIHNKKGEK